MTRSKETWILRGDDWYISQAVILGFLSVGLYVLATDSSDQEDFWWFLWIGGFAWWFVRQLGHPSRATLEDGTIRFSGIFGSMSVPLDEVVAVRRSDHEWPEWTQPLTRPYIVRIETSSSGKIEIVWTKGVRALAMRLWELDPAIQLDLPDGTRLPR